MKSYDRINYFKNERNAVLSRNGFKIQKQVEFLINKHEIVACHHKILRVLFLHIYIS